jgi:hypothetical protein
LFRLKNKVGSLRQPVEYVPAVGAGHRHADGHIVGARFELLVAVILVEIERSADDFLFRIKAVACEIIKDNPGDGGQIDCGNEQTPVLERFQPRPTPGQAIRLDLPKKLSERCAER